MPALLVLFAITAILALLGGAAQRWGAESRDEWDPSYRQPTYL
jgi:hypothetical protein